jgi:transcriptional regulator with PAS, ATPase and Fis domain
LDQDARLILENYRWPGNVRELKNAVEQMSVLSETNMIGRSELLDILPQLEERNLPSGIAEKESDNFQEREILFKFLIEMKNDLHDLKSLVFNLIKTNDLNVPEVTSLKPISYSDLDKYYKSQAAPIIHRENEESYIQNIDKPIILENKDVQRYNKTEVVEQSLSLEDMEKDMIKKSLKRHAGKRKDVAEELGISERTLYRKIKQFDIPD